MIFKSDRFHVYCYVAILKISSFFRRENEITFWLKRNCRPNIAACNWWFDYAESVGQSVYFQGRPITIKAEKVKFLACQKL